MSEISHLKVSSERKPKNLADKVLGCFDFDDELLDRGDRLEIEQWLSD